MSTKTPSRRRATTRHRTPSFEAMAIAAAARATLLPDVTDLLTADLEEAMIEAYIDQHCADDSKQSLRDAAKADRHSDHTSLDIVWLKQEVAFALGVEVGRRLGGGAR